MKKSGLLLILFVFSYSAVFAQSATSSSGRPCIQVITPLRNKTTNECRTFSTPCDVPADLGADWQKDLTCLRGNQTSTLPKLEQRSERIRNYAAQMQERLNVIVDNLEKIAIRVENHINKLAQENADGVANFSAAKERLADAKTKIQELKTAISDLTAKAEDIIKSKTPKTAFYAVREKFIKRNLIAKIKVIHKDLWEAVAIAKKEVLKEKIQNKKDLINTTSTATTTNN